MELLTTRIDLDAIAHNVAVIKDQVAPARLMAVVKADGYNHGAAEVARTAMAAGADALGVTVIEEAIALRDHSVIDPVLVWMWSPEEDFLSALARNIQLAITSPAHARALVEAGVPGSVTVKVETGMHRNGVDEEDWDEVFAMLKEAEHITVTGLMSHLACADDPADPATDDQAERFRRAIERARAAGLEVPVNHISNSAAVLSRPDLRFEMVRPGLILYGLDPMAEEYPDAPALKPAMTWVSQTVAVKPLRAGEATSYGHTWRAPEDGWIAIVAGGYADGLPRRYQGLFDVGIGGHRYPQVGRICMDQIVVWLGDNPQDVAQGDEAIIFGNGGISANEFARRVGTIPYEIACSPLGRTRRVHFPEQD